MTAPGSNLVPLAPVAITGADAQVLLATPAVGFAAAVDRVLVDNESPYLLQLTLGGGGFYLRPWQSNVFPTGGASSMLVHPIALTNPLPPAPSTTLLVTLVPVGEAAPGIYPMDSTRQASAYQQTEVIGTLEAPTPGGSVGPESFTLPKGTQAIGYAFYSGGPSGFDTPQEIEMIGNTTNWVYFLTTQGGNVGSPPARLLDPSDTSINVTLVANASHPSQIDVIAFLVSPAVLIAQGPGDFVSAELVAFSGGAIDTELELATNRLLAATLSQSFAPPWLGEPQSVEVASALANGGTVTPIAGVAGKTIYVLMIALGFDAASAGNDLQILDGGAAGTSRGRISAASVNPPAQFWQGRHMSSGNGLTLKANGAALTPRGTITYRQQ